MDKTPSISVSTKIQVLAVVELEINNDKKKNQEYKSIRNIPDSFKKIVIAKNDIVSRQLTEEGFLRMNLIEFLTNPDSLDW